GGATRGYCETGNCVIATAPMTSTNSAITHAKIGRSMKKRATPSMRLFGLGRRSVRRGGPGFGAGAGSAAGVAWGSGRDGRIASPRHRSDRRARHHHLLESVDDDLLAGLEPA